MKNKVFKALAALSISAAICAFSACSSDKAPSQKKETEADSGSDIRNEISFDSGGQKVTIDEGTPNVNPNKGEQLDKSPLAPDSNNKHVQPDLSQAKPKAASTSVPDTSTEEKFIDALESFANPNGNKYDAMAVLGSFAYNEDSDALYKRFETASKSWHEQIVSKVGEKCIVDITLKSKGDISNTAEKFAEWQRVHGGIAEDYTNVKCIIKSNYSSSSVTYSIDIVKIGGKWHLANTDVMEKLQDIIINELFR